MKRRIDSGFSFLHYLTLTSKGFCMGAADVVPGVSGGTMAFMLGIYEELLEAVRSFDLKFLRLLTQFKTREALDHVPWRFFVPLLSGIFLAIFSLARILSWLLHNRPALIWAFFLGLILASVYSVGRHLPRWDRWVISVVLLGTIGSYLLVGIVPVSTPNSAWFLMLCGAVAICAMILPGISGSFILVLLGKYAYVLEAVNNRDFFTLLLVSIGAGIGIITFVRLLNWLLKDFHDFTIAFLIGLMLGALRKVWPWKRPMESLLDTQGDTVVIAQANILPPHLNSEVALALFLFLVGFFVVLGLDYWAGRGKDLSDEKR